MTAPRYVCIHGHFYQPPRENPWLEAVEVQDSAAPYHDWNERITRECYAPNARARLVSDRGRIINLINNYAWMSFNFGPTLLSWLDEKAPEVVRSLVEADRASRERCGGHGNALAQAYNHLIMPLASERDKRTQVRWGVADFRRRFGRDPEGMWLPEAAVDTPTLEVLADAGIRFTILAPRQAKRWRRAGAKDWDDRGGIDPSRAYRCKLPSGKSIALFFYDGGVAQQVAFERLLDSGERFLDRLLAGFDSNRKHAQLMHIATDGESYGHHHAFGDMALAYVLDRLRGRDDVRLTNYGEFLALHPPEWEVELHENSSWSCAHGVERWRSDCGCKMRGDWGQGWRGPLRAALDRLNDKLDAKFGTEGRKFFPDPWAARDAYIDVLLDRRDAALAQFFRDHAYPDLADDHRRDALWLLEMERQSLLMFTSCGWFFDEVSGLETPQCLRYAGRAIQLAKHFSLDLEPEFLRDLELAPSNLPQFKTARGVWEQVIRPAKVDLDRVLAHYAMSIIYEPPAARTRVYCFDIETLDCEVVSRGPSHVAVGRLHVRSRITLNEAETTFVVIHYGGLDFYTALRKTRSQQEYDYFKTAFLDAYRKGSLADVSALAAQDFAGEVHRLDDLFTEERRRIIGIVLQDRFEDYGRAFERLANQDEDPLNRLGQLRYPIPKPLRAAAEAYLDDHLRDEVAALHTDGSLGRIRALLDRGRAWHYQPQRERLGKGLSESLNRLLRDLQPESDLATVVTRVAHIGEASGLLGITLELWSAQNQLLDAYARLADENRLTPALRTAFATLADRLNLTPDLLGWRS
jgi:hypothetical protein